MYLFAFYRSNPLDRFCNGLRKLRLAGLTRRSGHRIEPLLFPDGKIGYRDLVQHFIFAVSAHVGNGDRSVRVLNEQGFCPLLDDPFAVGSSDIVGVVVFYVPGTSSLGKRSFV